MRAVGFVTATFRAVSLRVNRAVWIPAPALASQRTPQHLARVLGAGRAVGLTGWFGLVWDVFVVTREEARMAVKTTEPLTLPRYLVGLITCSLSPLLR